MSLVLGLVVEDPVLPEPLPEPMPVDGLVLVEPPVELPIEPEPDAPLPALPLRPALSRTHLSRSRPVSPMHWLGVLVLPEADVSALPDAPVLPEVADPPAAAPPEAPPEVESDAPLDPVAEGELVLEPDEPEAPVLPDDEPEDCANAPAERARSAAAVAAVMVFSVI